LNEPVTLVLLDAKLEAIKERLTGMDKALSLQTREEFSKRSELLVDKEMFNQLKLKVNRQGTWGSVIAALIAILQVILILLKLTH